VSSPRRCECGDEAWQVVARGETVPDEEHLFVRADASAFRHVTPHSSAEGVRTASMPEGQGTPRFRGRGHQGDARPQDVDRTHFDDPANGNVPLSRVIIHPGFGPCRSWLTKILHPRFERPQSPVLRLDEAIRPWYPIVERLGSPAAGRTARPAAENLEVTGDGRPTR